MKTCPTFTASIYVGLKEGDAGNLHSLEEARIIIQEQVDGIKLCVTLTPTEFIYTQGNEPGVIIGLINYPRFPQSYAAIKANALHIAWVFLARFRQQRISVVFPAETIMIEEDVND